MKLSELVTETRNLLMELEDGVDELFKFGAKELSDRDYANLWALWNSCRIYEDDIVALCYSNRYWSVIVLLRSLFDGTAKFAYLLSSLDKRERERRFDCYCEYAREKDMGSIEQSSVRMLKDGEYGTGERAAFVKNHMIRQIESEKTPSGCGARNRLASDELSYKKITNKLAEEFSVWKMFQAHIDNLRARANGFSHLNSLACEDIMRTELSRIKNSCQDFEAIMSPHLTEVCVLKRIRSEAMLRAFGKSDTRYCEIMRRHKFFWRCCSQLADEKVENMLARSYMERVK